MDTNPHQDHPNVELLFKQEVYAIVGAAMEVFNELGVGFLESVYQAALEEELGNQNVPYEAQKKLLIHYKGKALEKYFTADLVCHGKIVVELKCVPRIGDAEVAQALNYLKATGLRLCLIINFGNKDKLEFKRVIR